MIQPQDPETGVDLFVESVEFEARFCGCTPERITWHTSHSSNVLETGGGLQTTFKYPVP